MGFGVLIVVAALTFGVCYLVDRGFKSKFRGKVEHASGLSVRLNKRYATIGLILTILGVSAIFAGLGTLMILVIGGCIVLLMGAGCIVYYLTFGIFYNDESFVLTTFGKRSMSYRYDQIVGQQLYNASGNILIELHLKDGRAVTLQAAMVGVYPFLDKAFASWCRQTGRDPESCEFHDPENSIWFPALEVE